MKYNMTMKLKTDILLSCGERTLIIDTKYYTNIMREYYGKDKLREAHLNQINTYVTQYDREHHYNVDGMLLYAKTKEDMGDDKKIALKERLIEEIGKEETETIWLRAKEILREIEERHPDISKGEQMHVGFIFPYTVMMGVSDFRSVPSFR